MVGCVIAPNALPSPRLTGRGIKGEGKFKMGHEIGLLSSPRNHIPN